MMAVADLEAVSDTLAPPGSPTERGRPVTYATAHHRELDRAAARAMGDPPGHALVRSRYRMKDMRTMTSARVLLTTLSVRTSAKGRPYLSGWLGKASVVAFEGEPDRFGNPTWNIFVAEPEPREGAPAAARSAQP